MSKKRIVVVIAIAAAVCCLIVAASGCKKKHVHAWGQWQIVTPATCTTAGIQKRMCDCGEEEVAEVKATGHDYGQWDKTVDGHARVCRNGCGEKEAGAHDYGTDNICKVCRYEMEYTESLTYGEIKDEEKTIAYEVTGCQGNETEILVPAYHNGLPVTAIADYAFYAEEEEGGQGKYKTIESISLPYTVKRLGIYAFGACGALSEVKTSPEITTIDTGAFYACSSLTSLILGDKTRTLGDYVFYEAGIKDIVLPSAVTSVGKQAFQSCANLKSVTFECAPQCGDYMFWLCEKLDTVILDHNEMTLGGSMFYDFAEASVDLVIGDAVTSIAPKLFGDYAVLDAKIIKTVTIGKNVETIGEHAFEGFSKITEITVPEKTETIKASAFDLCKSIKKVVLPKSIKTIDGGAFAYIGADALVEYAGTLYDWMQIDFANRLSNPTNNGAALLIEGKEVSDVEIDGVESIKQYAFYGLQLRTITIGESVKRIEQDAFSRNSGSAAAKIESVTVLSKKLSVTIGGFANSFNTATEVYYKGTAEEMETNLTYEASNINYFKYCKHYFYSETTKTDVVKTNSDWSFGGYWKFDSDGKTVVKTDVA